MSLSGIDGYTSFMILTTSLPAGSPFWLGSSYVMTPILVALPRAFRTYSVSTLSEQYTLEMFPDLAENGFGTGFSAVAEAWLNFGWGGPVLLGLAWGLACRFVESRERHIAFYLLAIMSCFLFRSDFATICKLWGVIYGGSMLLVYSALVVLTGAARRGARRRGHSATHYLAGIATGPSSTEEGQSISAMNHISKALPRQRWSVLHLMLTAAETNAAYNEFALASSRHHDVEVVSLFPAEVPAPESLRLRAGDGSLRRFIRLVRRALSGTEFDVVHCHSPHAAFLYLVAVATMRRRQRPRSLLTLHCAYSNLKFRNRVLLLSVMAGLDHVNFCSRSARASYPRWLTRLAVEPGWAIQNGVDLARIDRERAPQSAPRSTVSDALRLACIGRLVPSKNVATVLRAFARAARPGDHLLVAGEGPLKNRLLALARELGIDHQVSMPGVIPRRELFERLESIDCVVSASRREGLPIAVLEALACSVPVLLSDIPAHQELLAGSAVASAVPVDDERALAVEIERLRDAGAFGRQQIGRAGRAWVEQKFPLDRMQSRYDRLYAHLHSPRRAA